MQKTFLLGWRSPSAPIENSFERCEFVQDVDASASCWIQLYSDNISLVSQIAPAIAAVSTCVFSANHLRLCHHFHSFRARLFFCMHCGQCASFSHLPSRRTQFLQGTISAVKFLQMVRMQKLKSGQGVNTPYSPHPQGEPHPFKHQTGPPSPPSRKSPEETPEQLVLHRNAKDMGRCCTAPIKVLIHGNKPVNPACAETWSEHPQTTTGLPISACLTGLPTPESDMRHLEIEVHAQDLNWHFSNFGTSAIMWAQRLTGPVSDATNIRGWN